MRDIILLCASFISLGCTMIASLPQPTGGFNVGTITCYLSDQARREEHSHSDEYRELVLHVYYPTQQNGEGKVIGNILQLSSHLFADTPHTLQLIEDFRGHAQSNAPLVYGVTKLPLILFSHGLGDPPLFYTSLLEDLASHGYVVVAVQHTYGCEPALLTHERVIPMSIELVEFYKERTGSLERVLDHEHDVWTEDLLYVIDLLKNTEHVDACANLCSAMDFDNIGMFGHSFGGSAATTLSRISDDVKAVVNLDGVLWGSYWAAPLVKPALFIMAGKLPTEDELLAAGFTRDQWERIMARSPQQLFEQAQGDAFYITIKSAEHMTFNDLYHLKNLGNPGDVSYENDMKLTRSLLHLFFDTYLKGKESKLTELMRQNCENVIFQERL